MKNWKYWLPYLLIIGLFIMEASGLKGMCDTCIRERKHWWPSLVMHLTAILWMLIWAYTLS